MNVLLKNIKIIEKGNPLNQKLQDILIENGIVKDLGKDLKVDKSTVEMDGTGLSISAGWFDLNVHFNDPGEEQKEDLHSGAQAAAWGGFTGVALMPETTPVLDCKSAIEYIKNKSKGHILDIIPIGAASNKREGKEMAELYDMQLSGAMAFSDSNKSIQDSGVLSRIILYAKGLNAKVWCFCEDKSIAGGGKMNEGVASTEMGIVGIPSLAEELMVQRAIGLSEYHNAPLHIVNVSSKASVELIRQAKKKGLPITCDVSINHLMYSDNDLLGFESNFKLSPPLRTGEDQQALLEGLADNTIDAVCSQHRAQDKESKEVEFEIAAYGAIGTQTLFSNLLKVLPKMAIEDVLEKISSNPRAIIGLEPIGIKKGSKANFTLFNVDENWKYTLENNKSKSSNSAQLGTELKGRAKAIINNNQILKLEN